VFWRLPRLGRLGGGSNGSQEVCDGIDNDGDGIMTTSMSATTGV